MKTGRPNIDVRVRGQEGPFQPSPSWLGGHSWEPMSFSPNLDYAYIPFIESTETYEETPIGKWKFKPDRIDDSVGFMMGEVKGGILAWDPVRQREVWRHYRPSGVAGVAGGAVATAGGLVFQGTGSGYLIAYDACSARELWRANADNGVLGCPIFFELDGHQYVAVMPVYPVAPIYARDIYPTIEEGGHDYR